MSHRASRVGRDLNPAVTAGSAGVNFQHPVLKTEEIRKEVAKLFDIEVCAWELKEPTTDSFRTLVQSIMDTTNMGKSSSQIKQIASAKYNSMNNKKLHRREFVEINETNKAIAAFFVSIGLNWSVFHIALPTAELAQSAISALINFYLFIFSSPSSREYEKHRKTMYAMRHEQQEPMKRRLAHVNAALEKASREQESALPKTAVLEEELAELQENLNTITEALEQLTFDEDELEGAVRVQKGLREQLDEELQNVAEQVATISHFVVDDPQEFRNLPAELDAKIQKLADSLAATSERTQSALCDIASLEKKRLANAEARQQSVMLLETLEKIKSVRQSAVDEEGRVAAGRAKVQEARAQLDRVEANIVSKKKELHKAEELRLEGTDGSVPQRTAEELLELIERHREKKDALSRSKTESKTKFETRRNALMLELMACKDRPLTTHNLVMQQLCKENLEICDAITVLKQRKLSKDQ